MSMSRIALLAGLASIATAGPAQVGDPLAPLPDGRASRSRRMVQVHRPIATTAASFEAYKQLLAARSRAAGVRDATIANVCPYLTLDERVVRLDRGQPGADRQSECHTAVRALSPRPMSPPT